MVSLTDPISPQAQTDFEALRDSALPFALQTIAKRGELLPFGYTVSGDGELAMIGALPEGDAPLSDDVLAMLQGGVRANRDSLRAAIYVSDVRTSGSDAVRLQLEHSEGAAITFAYPYKRNRFRKTLTQGKPFMVPGDLFAWAE
ncbi:hypothetical protein ACI2IX_10740 [Leifsonia aquatica]|uniref:hypothetical protein n=1 Tax=Leifsonia aquatica TaxID=144185 RepID=UPI003850B32A